MNSAKANQLRAACQASRDALGVDAIDLYQLHAVDPATPFDTSVRALADLQQAGVVRRIGLCNVSVSQIRAARALVEIASVQMSLSPFDIECVRSGVAEYCREEGLQLLAYRPLGGVERVARLARDPALRAVAERSGATAQEVVLAWLGSFGSWLVPLPGATRVDTAVSAARAFGGRTRCDRRTLQRASLAPVSRRTSSRVGRSRGGGAGDGNSRCREVHASSRPGTRGISTPQSRFRRRDARGAHPRARARARIGPKTMGARQHLSPLPCQELMRASNRATPARVRCAMRIRAHRAPVSNGMRQCAMAW